MQATDPKVVDDQIDSAVDAIGAIEDAGELLVRDPRPAVQLVRHWLADGGDAALFAFVSGQEAARGQSARIGAAVERRNALLRQLGRGMTARHLAEALKRYQATSWPRDRVRAACPYRDDDRRATFWRVFKLRDRTIAARQLRAILAAV